MVECWITGGRQCISRSQSHHSTLPIFHHSSEVIDERPCAARRRPGDESGLPHVFVSIIIALQIDEEDACE